MADSIAPKTAEQTFRSYTREQSDTYVQHRRSYHPDLFKIILDYHKSNNGVLDTVLDVGCGPGIATRGLAPYFNHAFGLDPSQEMIATARSLGGVTSVMEPIRFEVSSAEELGSRSSPPIIAGASVDVITAAAAAHWFDMDGFWPRAAQVLKPGGTIAFWLGSSMRVHPSMPNAAAIQEALTKIVNDQLDEYMTPGNRLARDLYVNLPLPWTIGHPVLDFDKSSFVRKEWNTDGNYTSSEQFFVGGLQTLTLDMLEKLLETGSPITRWREAHQDLVGTEQDVVRVLRREIERLLHEAGVEPGTESVTGALSGALLMMKKKRSDP